MRINDNIVEGRRQRGPASRTRMPFIGSFFRVVSDKFWFMRAYCAIRKVHRELDHGGWTEVRSRLEQEKAGKAQRKEAHELVARIERAVVNACHWQWRPTACLPRSIVAYRLLRDAGFTPELFIGFRVPILGHAWTELNGNAIADDMTPLERQEFTIMTRLPVEGSAMPATSTSARAI